LLALVGGESHEVTGGRITASKWETATFTFPDKMLAPDQPFVLPDKEPLVLQVSDRLTLKCIYVPAGKFLMGKLFYQCPHWQEEPSARGDVDQAFLHV
jgi:hypothetical protein